MSEENNKQITLEIRKLYVSDLSIEVPNAPEVFNEELNPEISLTVNHDIKNLPEENFYAINLRLTVTAKNQEDEKIIYLIEVVQSGVFEIAGLEEAQLQHAKHVYCTTALYPYAREIVSNAISRAGFPTLFLQPINFEMLYQQQLEQVAAQHAQSGEA